MENWHTTRNIF